MNVEEFMRQWEDASDTVEVQTSGSTGVPKKIYAQKSRMLASARATCDFLGLKAGDKALLCMSLDYIGAKMMVVRAIERGLNLAEVPPSGHPLASVTDQTFDFVAMVPMQVYNSLAVPQERECLERIRHLIIGGGAVDPVLEARLREFPNAVWSTYGMTETLSHVAMRRISGADSDEWYSPMPGVDTSLDEESRIVIDAPAVCAAPIVTNDIGVMAADGKRFRILGRADNVICSGGIKIHIEEVENMLRPHISVPFMIGKSADSKFGEVAVMLVEGNDSDVDSARKACETILDKYRRPKQYIGVPEIPRTPNGKPARSAADRLVR